MSYLDFQFIWPQNRNTEIVKNNISSIYGKMTENRHQKFYVTECLREKCVLPWKNLNDCHFEWEKTGSARIDTMSYQLISSNLRWM